MTLIKVLILLQNSNLLSRVGEFLIDLPLMLRQCNQI